MKRLVCLLVGHKMQLSFIELRAGGRTHLGVRSKCDYCEQDTLRLETLEADEILVWLQ